MTVNEIPVKDGVLICTDGRTVSPEKCRMCMHSRYFVIGGKQEKSPALAFCQVERVTKVPDIPRSSAGGCAEKRGDGFHNVSNIFS